MKKFLISLAALLAIAAGVLLAQQGNQVIPGAGAGSGSGVVGGTFGASPSGGYTFTSTPITTNPFNGNLLIGTLIKTTDSGTLTAGTGWTLALGTGCTIGIEYQIGALNSSYTAGFSNSASQVWGGTISAFNATSPTLAQAAVCAVGTNAVSTGSNVSAGNFLFSVFRYQSSTTGPITAVNGCGGTWRLVGLRSLEAAVKGVGDSIVQEVWIAPSAASGACTVTATGISGATAEAAITVWTGVASSNFLVDYAYNQDGTGNTATTTPVGATTNNQYTINAIDSMTGAIYATGRDSCAVERAAATNRASVGGLFYYKNGIYPCQSSVQETNNGQTTWYGNITAPSPSGGATQASWHIVGESFTQATGSAGVPSIDLNGVVTLVLPSAYAGPVPGGGSLSAWYVRPAPSALNNSVFFINHACYIPDNQRTPTTCYDTSQSTYSYHENLIAGTVVPAVDQLCGGLTPAIANMTGFKTNPAGTNETFFENTWSYGWNTPYLIQSNHAVLINAHASCSQNAGILAVGSVGQALYGGQLIHYQDIHNIAGLAFNCVNGGTRFDVQNMIREQTQSGSFQTTTQATESNPGNCVGTVDVTTASANGVSFNPPTFFASGSGSNFRVNESTRLLQRGLITSSSTSAATTGTTKQTLITYTFPINISGSGPNNGPFLNNPGAVFRISAWGITAANADSKTVEIDFGGTTISTITSTVNNGSIRVSVDIVVGSAANTQECNGYADDGTIHTVLRTSPGIAGNANIVVNLAATTGTLAGDFTFKGWTIEYVGGN